MKEQTTGVPAELFFFFFSPCTGGLRKFPSSLAKNRICTTAKT